MNIDIENLRENLMGTMVRLTHKTVTLICQEIGISMYTLRRFIHARNKRYSVKTVAKISDWIKNNGTV